jgi:peptidoglycan hydrolase-like protein with peptidoglycan-binding domain
MPGFQRDLAMPDPWIASLERSRARRARAGRRGRGPTGRPPGLLLAMQPGHAHARDLAAHELWEVSLGRSRARRRAAELHFVPAGTRAKRLSLGTLAALTVGPTASIADGPSAATPATSAPEPATTAEHGIVLTPESEGRQVSLLQRALGSIKVDGVFGPETEQAVRQFQSARGLAVDGVAGPTTTAALRSRASTNATFASFTRNVPGEAQAPNSGESVGEVAAGTSEAGSAAQAQAEAAGSGAVKRLQGALRLHVDGEFGPETFAAIERLQARQGLTVDGIVGPATWKAIGVSHEAMLEPPASALPPEPPAPEQPASEGSVTSSSTGGAGAPGDEPVAVAASARGAASSDEGGSGGSASSSERAPERSSSEGSSEGSSGGGSSSSSSSSGGGEEGSGAVGRVISAGNEIASRPYVYGGGHGSFRSNGYDCSGSVSYALHGGGLIRSPQDSTSLESYGESGPGKHITVYANSEHAFMVVNGRRFDTVARQEGGSRWSSSMTSTSGYVVRHPAGY